MDDELKELDRLRGELHLHNHHYYIENAPVISDREFDILMHRLEELEARHPEAFDPNSPTQRPGSDIAKGFVQVPHVYPMLSLANTYSVEEVDSWVRGVERLTGSDRTALCGELKFDGTGISLIYEHGRLVRAVTRGDGEKGDDVTDNVRTIRTIPLVLQGEGYPDFFELRGEIVLPWKAFNRLNAQREEAGESLFANPRNAAAGTLKMQNSAEVARRGLDAYVYYLLGEDLPYATHYDAMQAVRSWGFKVSDAMTLLTSIEEVDAFIRKWDEERHALPVATDGLVFKVNDLALQQELGLRAKSPRWAVAYKFAAERALTPLRFVSFDVGRMGIITPVANLEPVLLSGTIVKRASLHNEDIMNALDIHEGDHLYVEKGGEIIPKITGVDESARRPGAGKVRFVSHCPACGTQLVRVEGEAAWVCPNKWGCPPQIVGRIEHFVGRRMMDIDGIGEETAWDLYNAGFVRNFSDLYRLTPEQLMQIEGFAQKSAERVIEGIRRSCEVPFDRVVYALSIPFVGETTAKKIARTVGDIDRLMTMTRAELESIEDVGPRIAESILDYFATPVNREAVEALRAAGVKMAMDKDENSGPAGDTLAGKTVVISGVFTRHSRDEYKNLIERHGGKNAGSVSKKTDFILAGDNMGPAKLEKARSLGVPMIDEDEFLRMLNIE